MDQFKQLGISESILRTINEFGFEEPTEVQKKSIPFVLKGEDILAGAATGSGKTLVFGSGIIQNSEKQGVIQSLVLVPTRELAEQVTRELRKFSKNKQMSIVEVYGGVSISKQITKLEKADIVVGTPGRVLDHISRDTIELGFVKILVLDEADRMLDMGFIRDVKRIIGRCPNERQTMLFSATLPHNIIKLSEDCMSNPIKISCKSDVDPVKLTQFYYDVPDSLKFSTLVHFLKEDKSGLVMVFCNTQKNTDFVAKNLQEFDINALAIHGGHTQDKRKKTMDQFHAKNVDVLVCTDVAARGLDIKGVSHVYNYDLPRDPIQYIHRIGRTARAGKQGKAIIILASRDYDNFSNLNKEYPEIPIQKKDLPEIERLHVRFKGESFRRRGSRKSFRGNRGSSSRKYGGRRERGERTSRYRRNRDLGIKEGSRDRRPRRNNKRFSREDRSESRDRRYKRDNRRPGNKRFSKSNKKRNFRNKRERY